MVQTVHLEKLSLQVRANPKGPAVRNAMSKSEAGESRWFAYYEKTRDSSILAMFTTVMNNLQYFLEIIKFKPRSILEIGTGRGLHAIFLSYFVPEVVGVDIEGKLLKKAVRLNRKFRGKAQFLAMDAFSPGFADQTFSVCCSQGFFEHFANSDIQALTRKHLKAAKALVFSVPSDYYPAKNMGDERLMSQEEWKRILKDVSVRIFYYGVVLDSSKGILGNLKWNSLRKAISSPRRAQICIVATT
jgi:SAM-dependent methyltransferase